MGITLLSHFTATGRHKTWSYSSVRSQSLFVCFTQNCFSHPSFECYRCNFRHRHTQSYGKMLLWLGQAYRWLSLISMVRLRFGLGMCMCVCFVYFVCWLWPTSNYYRLYHPDSIPWTPLHVHDHAAVNVVTAAFYSGRGRKCAALFQGLADEFPSQDKEKRGTKKHQVRSCWSKEIRGYSAPLNWVCVKLLMQKLNLSITRSKNVQTIIKFLYGVFTHTLNLTKTVLTLTLGRMFECCSTAKWIMSLISKNEHKTYF